MDSLINVLNLGKEHIKELSALLDIPGSADACKFLAFRAHSAFSTAVDMAKQLEQTPKPDMYDFPLSTSDSRSEGSEKTFKDQEISKKRKVMPRWSRQVQACSASGSSMDGPVDDGHSWRKYGQKDILGSKFPRGYYRCTKRHTHGCLATKQVQRSDSDPSVFDVRYRGAHTCCGDRSLSIPAAPLPNTKAPAAAKCLISGDQQPSSSPFFSFPAVTTQSYDSPAFMKATAAAALEASFSLPLCGPSSAGAGPDFGGNSDFGLEQFEFDTDFPFDF